MTAKKEYTQEQKEALRGAKSMIDSLISNHGEEISVWATKRVLNNLRSLARLKKREEKLKSDLNEVRAKMNFEK